MTQIQITGLKRYTANNYNDVYYKMSFTLPATFGSGANPIPNLSAIVASYNAGFSVEIIPVTGTVLTYNGIYQPSPVNATIGQIQTALQGIYTNFQTLINSFVLSPFDSLAGQAFDGATWGASTLITDNPIVDSVLSVTQVGASGAAVTATLPAVAGKFHSIIGIYITLYNVAARTGGATPVTVTTTNISGNPALTFASAGAIGTTDKDKIEPKELLKSSVPNTATTIVCPIVTNALWRVNVLYKLI